MVTSRVNGNAVQDYYLARVRDLARAYDQRIDALRTRDDALKLVAASRRKIRASFGKAPKKTPLNMKITGSTAMRGYRIDNVIYESRPGLYVSANIYVTDKADQLHPGVVMACGHSMNGKAYAAYQSMAASLALQGYEVIIYDPIGQGERAPQYRNKRGKPLSLGCCHEHNIMGNQMTLVGEFFGAWRAWDGIRALDVLLSRPKIDKTRIGVTGCSGGGTLTTYLTSLDARFTMAAPDCFVTTYLQNTEAEMPADAEQIPPNILGSGLDMADFFLAYAPRPTILLEEANDFFDVRGTQVTFDRIQKVYRLLGKSKNVEMYVGPSVHGYNLGARVACADFFNRQSGITPLKKEPKHQLLDDAKLFATPKGDVLKLPGARRIDQFTADTSRTLAASRKRLTGAALNRAVTNVLNLPKRKAAPHYRSLRLYGFMEEPCGKYEYMFPFGLETEAGYGGLLAVLQHWQEPEKEPHTGFTQYRAHPCPNKDVTVYVPHLDSMEDFYAGHAPKAQGGHMWAVDPRGTGTMKTTTCYDAPFFTAYDADYFYYSHALMLGEPYVGGRVHDVLAALDLLQQRGAQRVHLVGRGLGSVVASFAALLHPAVKQVTLHNALSSYEDLAKAYMYDWPASAMPFGVLKQFDLPDVYAALKKKKLRQIDRWDVSMKPRK